jgi:hypothetical protein
MRCESGVHILRSADADAGTFDLNVAACVHDPVRWRKAFAKNPICTARAKETGARVPFDGGNRAARHQPIG